MDFIKQIIKQIVDKLFCCHKYKLFKEIRVDNTGIDHDGTASIFSNARNVESLKK